MQTFSLTRQIAAPVERVWQVMSDVERWHEWTPSVTSIRRFGGGGVAIGSRAIVKQPRFPPALWKVTALEPGRSFTWVSIGPGLRVVGVHRVDPSGGGSRATLTLEYHGPLGSLLGRMTAGITERYLVLEGNGLKARSEDPGWIPG
ncbi:MAG: SRPBCC family protein [Gemmatimonadaceae bacterium]